MAMPMPPMLKEKNLLMVMEIMSVPPSEARFFITIPDPIPIIRPPKIAATMVSFTSITQLRVRDKRGKKL